jgi:CBS domain-containing protein
MLGVEGDRPVGLITDRDLVIRVMAKALLPQEVTVRVVMITNPVCVPQHTSLVVCPPGMTSSR